jgi:Flp pilus assembly pilin Flp
MARLVRKLWRDDCGALIAVEWVFVATILVLGVIVGLVGVEAAVNSELSEFANAVMALDQSYRFDSQSNCKASKAGSAATDSCDRIPIKNSGVAACNAEDSPCD